MRRGLPDACVALLVAIALAACSSSSDPPAPTADEQARALYETVASGSNAFLMGDHLGYSGADDAVERVGVRCLDDTCAAAFTGFFRSSEASVESTDLELLGSRRGVSLVEEKASTDNVDVHVYGAWLDHSLFATESVLLKSDRFPDQGATVALSYSFGFSTGEDPGAAQGSARWEGLMIGREMRASPGRGQTIRGDAAVTVEFGRSAITADVDFTDIANTETGERRDDMAWRGMALEQGSFARRNAPNDTISGRFYGPEEEEGRRCVRTRRRRRSVWRQARNPVTLAGTTPRPVSPSPRPRTRFVAPAVNRSSPVRRRAMKGWMHERCLKGSTPMCIGEFRRVFLRAAAVTFAAMVSGCAGGGGRTSYALTAKLPAVAARASRPDTPDTTTDARLLNLATRHGRPGLRSDPGGSRRRREP